MNITYPPPCDILCNVKFSRLFPRYLISFVLVFLIPLLSLGFFVNKYLFNILLEKELENKRFSLATNVSIIEMRMNEIGKLCIQISSDGEINPFLFEEEPFQVYKLIRNISQYTFTNNFISNLYLLFRDDSFFYSSSNAQSLPYLFEQLGINEYQTLSQFKSIIYNSTGLEIGSGRDIMVLTYPYPTQSRKPSGTLLIRISKGTLKNYLITDSMDKICVLSPANQVIFGDISLTLLKEQDNLIIYRSGKTDWEYRLLVDRESILQKIRPVKKIFFIILTIILVIGFIISTLVTFYHYLPIRKMGAYFASEQVDSDKEKDEFEIIKSSFLNVIKEEEDLRQEMKERELIFKRDIISRLLNGRISDQSTLKKAGIKMDFSSFAIGIINISCPWNSSLYDDYLIMEGKSASKNFYSHIISDHSSSQQQFIVLVRVPNKAFNGKIFLDEFLDQWKENKDINLFISLSSQKSNISQVGEAYLEALAVKNNQRSEKTSGVLQYGDIVLSKDSYANYPYDIIEKLRGAIENRRTDAIKDSGSKLVEILKMGKLDIMNSRRLYFNIINTLLTGLQKGKSWDEEELPIPDLFTLDQLESINDMINLIDKSIERVIELLEMKDNDHPIYLKELVVYIEKNYTNPNLSLQSLSDHFHLTPAYLSASFKKYVHANISDYIGDLRIKKAKKLLITSQLPLKAIVVSLGYADVSSFIRKFRSREEITPGEYRMNHSKK
jgi:two-component system response regulator YesN